jgi:hypothetical protein
MARDSAFARSEKARLIALGGASLYPPFREGVLKYYKDYCITWWGGSDGPTDSPISSQVACINHLEPARLNHEVAIQLARKHIRDAAEVLPIEGGFLAYEWVGTKSYLKERGWSPKSRGKNITSVDALMVVKRRDGQVSLIVIEWKYTECYSGKCLSISDKGTKRVEIYRSLLEEPECPIRVGDYERLFFDPYYQLMRQTLLAWQMIKHRELGATDWVHVHVAPRANVQLLEIITSPRLTGFRTMEGAWKSVLVEPGKYRLVSPHEALPSIESNNDMDRWLTWLAERYSVNSR